MAFQVLKKRNVKNADLMLRKLGELNINLSFVILQNGAKDTCSSKYTVRIRNKVAWGDALREDARQLQVFNNYLCFINSKENAYFFFCRLLIGWKLILLFWCNSLLYTFIKMVFRFIFFLHSLFDNALLFSLSYIISLVFLILLF